MAKADDRRDEIAAYIMRQGQVRIDDLAMHFAVSRMTIHRHIDQLARQGMLRKLHGAVSVQPSGVYESAFRYRATVQRQEKNALARAAMDYVEAGQVVMLDDSSTANACAPFLCEIKPLTVVTNNLETAHSLTTSDEVDLICLGGQYHPTYNACIGLLCERAVAQLRANVLICSASAVSGTTCFIQDQQVVRVKQAMMASSGKRILLIDHTKFDKTALNVFADLAAFDAVIVTDGVGKIRRHQLEEAGIPLKVVKASS